MIHIDVVMASYLGEYEGCAPHREYKLHRAILSFLNNTYPNKDLIIVSDGCELTNKVAAKYPVTLIEAVRHPLWSGGPRNIGLNYCRAHRVFGDIVCYLDSDDVFGENHLQNVVSGMFDAGWSDWVYWDYFYISRYGFEQQVSDLAWAKIGTSAIAHLVHLYAYWEEGYGHDFAFIQSLRRVSRVQYKKITGAEYYVCHYGKYEL